jgi:hypothetical protein
MGRKARRALKALSVVALVALLSTCAVRESAAPFSGTLEFTFLHYASADAETPDGRTTAFLRGATVNLKRYDAGSSSYAVVATTTTGSQGEFSFPPVEPGEYAADAAFSLDTASSVSCYVEYSHDGRTWHIIDCTYVDDAVSGKTQVTTEPMTGVSITADGGEVLDIEAWGSNF